MGLACRHFWFDGHVVESNRATNEGIFGGHHLIQFKNYRIGFTRSFDIHNRKDGGGNAQATENMH